MERGKKYEMGGKILSIRLRSLANVSHSPKKVLRENAKVFWGNAKVLRGNGEFLWGMQNICKRTQKP